MKHDYIYYRIILTISNIDRPKYGASFHELNERSLKFIIYPDHSCGISENLGMLNPQLIALFCKGYDL